MGYENVRFPDKTKRMSHRPTVPSYDHPVVKDGTTFYPKRIKHPDEGGALLKSGHHNWKIGKIVQKGHWKGLPIYTLTLTERATCPRSCALWRMCYGNNMNWSVRWQHGPELEELLEREVWRLERLHRKGFVVRLHVLGDFYSTEYVDLWRRLLRSCEELRVFGFTAREPDSEIGAAVAKVRDQFPERWWIRFSGSGLDEMAAEVIDMPGQERPGTIVCPEQMKQTKSCSECGLCWHSTKNIAFLRH
jgi:hypothetical protein